MGPAGIEFVFRESQKLEFTIPVYCRSSEDVRGESPDGCVK
jgi:hypothetical protein